MEQGKLLSDQGFDNSPCKLFSSLYLYEEPSMGLQMFVVFCLSCGEDLRTGCCESTCIQIPRRKQSCHWCHVFLFPEALHYMKVEPIAGHGVVAAHGQLCGFILTWCSGHCLTSLSIPLSIPQPRPCPFAQACSSLVSERTMTSWHLG